jgi:cellulose biosynthesis protein BcsQ
MFDFVVVDTPAQFSEHVLTAMDVLRHHVLLTTPDTPALKNLRITLDMLDLLAYSRDIRSVVVNRSDSKVGLTSGDVERVVRSAISGHVPSSRNVPFRSTKGRRSSSRRRPIRSARRSRGSRTSGCSADRLRPGPRPSRAEAMMTSPNAWPSARHPWATASGCLDEFTEPGRRTSSCSPER